MTDIKTHLGYARAWVRLCLEKKLLYVHLTTLLSEENLLRYRNRKTRYNNNFNKVTRFLFWRTLYKRYAFLRCEDERNLFLTYLLTLNAADYHSFTHTYTSTGRSRFAPRVFLSFKNSYPIVFIFSDNVPSFNSPSSSIKYVYLSTLPLAKRDVDRHSGSLLRKRPPGTSLSGSLSFPSKLRFYKFKYLFVV